MAGAPGISRSRAQPRRQELDFQMESISLQEGDGIAPEGWESACDLPDGARQTLHAVAPCRGDLGTTGSATS